MAKSRPDYQTVASQLRLKLAKKNAAPNKWVSIRYSSQSQSAHGVSAGFPFGCRDKYALAAGTVEPAEKPTEPEVDLLEYARKRLATEPARNFETPLEIIQRRIREIQTEISNRINHA